MTHIDRFLAEGAYSCAGSLIHKNRKVGVLRDGELLLTDHGKDLLAKLDGVTDVVVKTPKSKKKVEVVEPTQDEAEAALDALLGE
jgi:archaellum component FlaF (FlaF/FlaG flagellin family)